MLPSVDCLLSIKIKNFALLDCGLSGGVRYGYAARSPSRSDPRFVAIVPHSMENSTAPTRADSPSFLASFERWRVAITSMTVPKTPLRCEQTESWEAGKIMQGQGEPTEKSEKELKQEAKECKRCEKWRDELTRDSWCFRSGWEAHFSGIAKVPNLQVRLCGSCSSTSPSFRQRRALSMSKPPILPLRTFPSPSRVVLAHQRTPEGTRRCSGFCFAKTGS